MTLKEQLFKHEGFIPHAYQDSLGYWTIGVGRLIDRRRGGKITKEEAQFLLDNDIKRVVAEVHKALPWVLTLNEARQEVLYNMAFNLGMAGLLKFRTTLAWIASGDYENAAGAMLLSKWATQVGGRAVELSEQMRTGVRA
ncbi:MAG: glycoside hydrolase family protein [Candidatus Binatia bacterium]